MASLDHILNVRKLAEVVTKEKISSIYYQLNDAVKGNTSPIDVKTIRSVKAAMKTKHAEAMAFFDQLERSIKQREKQ